MVESAFEVAVRGQVSQVVAGYVVASNELQKAAAGVAMTAIVEILQHPPAGQEEVFARLLDNVVFQIKENGLLERSDVFGVISAIAIGAVGALRSRRATFPLRAGDVVQCRQKGAALSLEVERGSERVWFDEHDNALSLDDVDRKKAVVIASTLSPFLGPDLMLREQADGDLGANIRWKFEVVFVG